ncbi:MAG TPA: MerR family transcriptional regulator [Bacilli bacterium]
MDELYKIGELARMANVSQRTIDYYTKLGLIRPAKRSPTNYRLYSAETVARLKRIEKLKQEKYSLEEIKELLAKWGKIGGTEEIADKIATLQIRLEQLEHEVAEIRPLIAQLKPRQVKTMLRKITPQTVACIEALFIFLGQGPIS